MQPMNEGQRRRLQGILDGIRTSSCSEANCTGLPLGFAECQALASALTGALLPSGAASTTAGKGLPLSTLVMRSNNIEREGAAALAPALKGTSLTSLTLSDNALGDEGVRALAAKLPCWSLRTLELSLCEIGTAGAKALALGLRGSSLQELDLSGNDIGDEGVSALAAGLAALPLRTLELYNAGIQVKGVKALAAALPDSLLENLRLGGNDFGDEGGQALLQGVKGSGIMELYVRDLPSTGCSLKTIGLLRAALEENKHRSFVLQMQVAGAEPEWVLTFRTLAGNVAAVLSWKSDRLVQELPDAVLAEMRASKFRVAVTAHHLRLLRPDGKVLEVADNAAPLTVQLARGSKGARR